MDKIQAQIEQARRQCENLPIYIKVSAMPVLNPIIGALEALAEKIKERGLHG